MWSFIELGPGKKEEEGVRGNCLLFQGKMKSKEEIRLPETYLVPWWTGGCYSSMCLGPASREAELLGTHSHTAHFALLTPTETWPAWLTWWWSSSSADQDESLYVFEDNKAPSVTGLRQSVYAVAGPRPLCPSAHSPTPAARTQTSSQYTQTKPGLPGSWSRPTFFQAAISHTGQPSIECPISPVADSQTSYPTQQLLWLKDCQQIPLTHEVLQFLRETYLRSHRLLASRPIDSYDFQSLLQLLHIHIHIQCTYTQNCTWDHTESRNRI